MAAEHPKPENCDEFLPAEIPADSPLAFLKLPSFQPLLNLAGRSVCPNCRQRRKFFCYDCNVFMGPAEQLPRLRLPVHVNIVHHPTETLSKSTATHARLLATEDVTIFEYPTVPEFDPATHVLAFPSSTAMPIGELDPASYTSIVFIDSQWHRANLILRHPNLQALRCVKISTYKTAFWRHQKVGPECLATIEAIYYFLRELVTARNGGVYNAEMDSLLYLYAFNYELIQNRYSKVGDTFKRIDGYIRSGPGGGGGGGDGGGGEGADGDDAPQA